MSQRDSGYARKPRDFYATPAWVTEALLPHIRPLSIVWEPACGKGDMVAVLKSWCDDVIATDIAHDENFLTYQSPPRKVCGIITNPPYDCAPRFIEHALRLVGDGLVAMLLRSDFDHAKSRRTIFAECESYAKKVILTRRIVWFEPEPGEKGKSPSVNHAWFVWDGQHKGPPTMAWSQ